LAFEGFCKRLDNMSANDANRDEDILAQKEAIEAQIRRENPLISDREDFTQLETDYQNDEAYLSKVKLLKDTYSHIRRVRPDGNCFFRAVGFAFMEQLLSDKKGKLVKFMDKIRPTKEEMVKMGFPVFTMEDFFDTFMETLESLQQDSADLKSLLQTFNDDGQSNYLIVFMRLLTSLNIKAQHEFYQNFLEGGQTVEDFCANEVEPMFKESDHIHIIAFCQQSGVNVRVTYLDRGSNKEAVPHDFPEGSVPDVHLLYKPGHYDIVYPKQA